MPRSKNVNELISSRLVTAKLLEAHFLPRSKNVNELISSQVVRAKLSTRTSGLFTP
jgi:hypothetical protein